MDQPNEHTFTQLHDQLPSSSKTNVLEDQLCSRIEKGRFSLGECLLDRYEVIRIIKGGMGTVYIVRDNKLGWHFAVKTINFSKSDLNDKESERFITEIEYLIELPPHHNIVQLDFLEFINDEPHIFMEFIDGTNLREKFRKAENKKLNLDDAIDCALQICEGINFIHEKGSILHLDIKPENILINHEGTVKISDFGISKAISSLRKKKFNKLSGTYLYMSPEHFTGEFVDTWSDIYSFGIVFYEMLIGKLPYPFDVNTITDAETLKQQLLEFHNSNYDFHTHFPHRSIEGLPTELGDILGHCLAKLPGKRVRDFRYLKDWIRNDFNQYIKNRQIEAQKINYHRKALNLQSIGKDSEALEYFNRALTDEPTNATLWNDAANSLLSLGMKSEGEIFRNKAKKLLNK